MEWNGLHDFAATINIAEGLFVSPDMAEAMKAVVSKIKPVLEIGYGMPVIVEKFLPPGSYVLIPRRLANEATKDWMKRWVVQIGEEVSKL